MAVGVFLANGFEEIEGLTVVDLLRRAGIEVITISIHDDTCICGAHQIKVEADCILGEVDLQAFEALVLPGGMPGTIHLQENEIVCATVEKYNQEGKLIAAICAAPTVFGYLGLLEGKKATCYPSMEEGLVGADVKYDNVVVDGNIITSRGLGTAIDFSTEIIRYLKNAEVADEIKNQIVYK